MSCAYLKNVCKGETAVNRSKLLLLSCTAWLLAGCATVVGNGYKGAHCPFAIAVSPANTTYLATLSNSSPPKANDGSNPAMSWSVNGVAGGNATTGTISTTGLFTAPEFPPSPNNITITATETNDSTKYGSSARHSAESHPTAHHSFSHVDSRWRFHAHSYRGSFRSRVQR